MQTGADTSNRGFKRDQKQSLFEPLGPQNPHESLDDTRCISLIRPTSWQVEAWDPRPFAPSAADVLRPTSLPGDRTSPVLDRRPLSIEVPPEAPENLHVHQDRGRFVGIF